MQVAVLVGGIHRSKALLNGLSDGYHITGPEAPQAQPEVTTEESEEVRKARTTDAHPVARRSRTGTSREGK